MTVPVSELRDLTCVCVSEGADTQKTHFFLKEEVALYQSPTLYTHTHTHTHEPSQSTDNQSCPLACFRYPFPFNVRSCVEFKCFQHLNQ